MYGSDLVYGMTLVKDTAGVRKVVAAADLGNPSSMEERFRAVHEYAINPARAGGTYVGAYPDFEQASYDGSLVYGVILIKPDAGTRKVIPAVDLGNPGSIEGRFRAVHEYAVNPARSGGNFVGGVPDFNQDIYNGQLVYGMTLIHTNMGTRDVVPVYRLSFLTDFTYDPGISPGQILQLRVHHAFACSRISGCSNLNDTQKIELKKAYQKIIHHGIDTNPNNYGSTQGTNLWINFNVLFPKGEDEIRQTLIHEMMHIAGYSHIEKSSATTPAKIKEYYNSPPLQAEICIAGKQSDAECDTINGKCVIHQ